ncbi:unnamed protein product [Amaranthus hypochondriacus]
MKDEDLVMKTKDLSMAAKMSTSNNKRLLFDRRYGWVIDEWKPPSEEALAGGRGMFCIVPLAKGLADIASYSISIVAESVTKVVERRDHFRPQQMQAAVGNQLQQLAAALQNPGFKLLTFKGKHAESSNMQGLESV